MYAGTYGYWLGTAGLPYANHASQSILRPTSTADETRLPAAAPLTIDKKVLPGGDVQINTYDPSTGRFSSSIVPNVGQQAGPATWAANAIPLRQSIIRYDDNAIGFNGQLDWLRDFAVGTNFKWDAQVDPAISIAVERLQLPTKQSLVGIPVNLGPNGELGRQFSSYAAAKAHADSSVRQGVRFLGAKSVKMGNADVPILDSVYPAVADSTIHATFLKPSVDGPGQLLAFRLDPASIQDNVFAYLVRSNTMVQRDLHDAMTLTGPARATAIAQIQRRWITETGEKLFPNRRFDKSRLELLRANAPTVAGSVPILNALQERLTDVSRDFNGVATRLLRHEQGHFDIAELYCRALRAELQSLRVFAYVAGNASSAVVADVASKAQTLLQQIAFNRASLVNKMMTNCNKYYDVQADHNHNAFAQGLWNDRIQTSLNVGETTDPRQLQLGNLPMRQ